MSARMCRRFKSISSCPFQSWDTSLYFECSAGTQGCWWVWEGLALERKSPLPPDGAQSLNSEGGGLTGTKGFVRAWLKDGIFIKGTEISPSNKCTDIS